MLIKDFRRLENYFGNVKPGTVFADRGGLYMAIVPIGEKDSDIVFNTVNLENGELTYYFDNSAIQLVEAELCVK